MNDSTLMLDCPVCRSDLAETLGVAGGGPGQPDASVVMCCEECGTVYLTPPPQGPTNQAALGSSGPPTQNELRRLAPGLARDARVTRIDAPGDLARTGSFDLVLLGRALECAQDPGELLRRAAPLLAPTGLIVVVTGNAGSSCFAAFGGRHWHGYQAAGTRQQFTAAGITRLSAASGLRVRRLSTRFAPSAWLDSAKYGLQDWGAGRALTAVLTGPWVVPALVAALFESIAFVRGRGAVLVAGLAPA